MKLNINAKELLALHNLLYERYNVHDGLVYKADDPRGTDDAQLRQVYNRLRACLVAALTNKATDPMEAFLSKEQAKIDKLREQNAEVKQEVSDLAGDILVPGEGEDFASPEYPRRGANRGRGGNRGGGKR